VFVSTHLITEFEGLIDEFTIMDDGRAALTLGADEARSRFQKIRARFAGTPPPIATRSATSSCGCRASPTTCRRFWSSI
jgi:ABC-type multidrug transport system ATPase subunit